MEMIQQIFDLFVKKNINVKECDETPDENNIESNTLYYLLYFNSNIDQSIIDDIINVRDAEHERILVERIGITSDEYFDNYVYKDIEHPTISTKQLQEVYNEISTELIPFIDKYALEKHSIEKEDLFESIPAYFDTESLVEMLDLKVVGDEVYDAYGTALYQVEDKQFVIFSTYDNGSSRKKEAVVYLCCYDPETFKFELADILHDRENNHFYISDVQTAYIPEDLREHHIRNFAGKRSYNWDVDSKVLKLRCWDDLRVYLAGKDNFKAYSKNVSGNRCEIQLT